VKKVIVLFIAAILLLCSCAVKEPDNNKPEENGNANVETESTIPEKDVTALLSVYSEVLAETFGADCDFSKPSKSDDMYEYYLVSNFKTADEVKEYLRKYITSDCFDEASVDENFADDNGSVFLLRGARGYGYYGIDTKSWNYVDETSIKVQFCILDAAVEDAFCNVSFIQENGKWMINGFTLPEGF
jgi:hypothetical protein